ncbi:MAG: type II TA system antitoxin MqsA family protein [Dissulfurispiraceae bacterium]
MFTKIREVEDECPLCEGVRQLVYGSQNETVRVRGEEIEVDVRLYYCPTGDHYFQTLDDDEERIQKAYREYRIRNGYLQPEEIRQLREQYGLSQRAFAEFLDWGVITIQRAESGALLDSGNNSLLVFLREDDNFIRYYKSRKPSISKKVLIKIEQRIKEMEARRYQLTFDFVFERARINVIEVVAADKVTMGDTIVDIDINRMTWGDTIFKAQSRKPVLFNSLELNDYIRINTFGKLENMDDGGLAIAA